MTHSSGNMALNYLLIPFLVLSTLQSCVNSETVIAAYDSTPWRFPDQCGPPPSMSNGRVVAGHVFFYWDRGSDRIELIGRQYSTAMYTASLLNGTFQVSMEPLNTSTGEFRIHFSSDNPNRVLPSGVYLVDIAYMFSGSDQDINPTGTVNHTLEVFEQFLIIDNANSTFDYIIPIEPGGSLNGFTPVATFHVKTATNIISSNFTLVNVSNSAGTFILTSNGSLSVSRSSLFGFYQISIRAIISTGTSGMRSCEGSVEAVLNVNVTQSNVTVAADFDIPSPLVHLDQCSPGNLGTVYFYIVTVPGGSRSLVTSPYSIIYSVSVNSSDFVVNLEQFNESAANILILNNTVPTGIYDIQVDYALENGEVKQVTHFTLEVQDQFKLVDAVTSVEINDITVTVNRGGDGKIDIVNLNLVASFPLSQEDVQFDLILEDGNPSENFDLLASGGLTVRRRAPFRTYVLFISANFTNMSTPPCSAVVKWNITVKIVPGNVSIEVVFDDMEGEWTIPNQCDGTLGYASFYTRSGGNGVNTGTLVPVEPPFMFFTSATVNSAAFSINFLKLNSSFGEYYVNYSSSMQDATLPIDVFSVEILYSLNINLVNKVVNRNLTVFEPFKIAVQNRSENVIFAAGDAAESDSLKLVLQRTDGNSVATGNEVFTLISENGLPPLNVDLDRGGYLSITDTLPPSSIDLLVRGEVITFIESNLCSNIVEGIIVLKIVERVEMVIITLISWTRMEISWTPPQDTSDIIIYEVLLITGASTVTKQAGRSKRLTNLAIPEGDTEILVCAVYQGNFKICNTPGPILFIYDNLRPPAPTDVQATEVASNMIEVTWKASSVVGEANYFIYIRSSQSFTNVSVGNSSSFIVSLSLTGNVDFTVSVVVVTAVGISLESEPVGITTLAKSSNLNIIIGASAGGGVIVLISLVLLIICLICCCLRKHRRAEKYNVQKPYQRSESGSAFLYNKENEVEMYANVTQGASSVRYTPSPNNNNEEVYANSMMESERTTSIQPLLKTSEEVDIYEEVRAVIKDPKFAISVVAKMDACKRSGPLWDPLTGKMQSGALSQNLPDREATPEDYDKEDIYVDFEKIYHKDASDDILGGFEKDPNTFVMQQNPIGEGEFGKVYKGVAKHLVPGETSTPVAIKVLKDDTSEKARKDFLSEAQILAHFCHPNILSLLGVCTKGKEVMVITDLFPKGDLKNYLKSAQKAKKEGRSNSQLQVGDLIRISGQIALGMEYLASKYFIHRDLAARNVLVGDGLHCVIADFGMSRVLAKDDSYYEMSSNSKLPFKWMAPEAIDYKKFSTYSDVWSFGVVLWEVASFGQTPLKKVPPSDISSYLRSGRRMAQPSQCPDELYQMMLKCWEFEKERRPTFSLLKTQLVTLQNIYSTEKEGTIYI